MRSRAKTYLSDDTNGVSPKKWIGKCIYPYYVYFRKNRSEKSWLAPIVGPRSKGNLPMGKCLSLTT